MERKEGGGDKGRECERQKERKTGKNGEMPKTCTYAHNRAEEFFFEQTEIFTYIDTDKERQS